MGFFKNIWNKATGLAKSAGHVLGLDGDTKKPTQQTQNIIKQSINSEITNINKNITNISQKAMNSAIASTLIDASTQDTFNTNSQVTVEIIGNNLSGYSGIDATDVLIIATVVKAASNLINNSNNSADLKGKMSSDVFNKVVNDTELNDNLKAKQYLEAQMKKDEGPSDIIGAFTSLLSSSSTPSQDAINKQDTNISNKIKNISINKTNIQQDIENNVNNSIKDSTGAKCTAINNISDKIIISGNTLSDNAFISADIKKNMNQFINCVLDKSDIFKTKDNLSGGSDVRATDEDNDLQRLLNSVVDDQSNKSKLTFLSMIDSLMDGLSKFGIIIVIGICIVVIAITISSIIKHKHRTDNNYVDYYGPSHALSQLSSTPLPMGPPPMGPPPMGPPPM
jgi:hypothetical protein